jgi:serine/threonine protein kinase
MVCATRPKSRSHETSGASANYKYAIMLPEGRGYLYIQELPVGANGAPQLVYSIETGKTCVRKQTRLDSVDETGFPNEVEIGRSLAGSGFVPFILEHNMVDDDRSFIIFEYCNGGDFDSYMKNKARSEEAAEVLIWHVIARAVRILTYLQTSQVEGDADAAEGPIKANDNQAWRSGNVPKPERYVKMEINKRPRREENVELQRSNKTKVDQGQISAAPILLQPEWEPIAHGNCHGGNVFLDFTKSGTDNPCQSTDASTCATGRLRLL